jgi:hypothetical protein
VSDDPADAACGSYHGQPIIKEPVWTWEIPCYFFTGGLAGASAALAWLSDLTGHEVLARRAWASAMLGIGISPVLLISDLGRPARFFNMLRMFKITSPMSVGSWILSGAGATTALSAANAWLGVFPRTGRLARPAAALLGLPLATYTAALVADTAVPVWHEARRELPFLFAAGAAMSAGAAAVIATPVDHARPARRVAIAAAIAEVATEKLMEIRLGERAKPYEHGLPHRFAQSARVCSVLGAGLLAGRGGSSRAAAAGAGALLLAGALSERWSVFRAGFASVADPGETVKLQRGRIERRGRAPAIT